MAFDPASNAVFVGAVDELGYLRLEPDGGRTFVSLKDQLPPDARNCRDIRRVHLTTAGETVFVAPAQVMIWQGGKFTVLQPGNKETLHSFLVDGRVFLHSRDLGLMRLENGKLVPVPNGADFLRTSEVIFLVSGAHPGELLAGTAAGALWTISANGSAVPFTTGADGFLQKHGLRCGQKLPDGDLALATEDAGLIWLGADGRFLGRVDQAAGLARDQILDLFTDREGGLWVGLSSGLARVELSEAVSVFDEHTGLPRTTINDVARIGGTLFLATDNGLFRLVPATPGANAVPAHCEPVAGEELWDLCSDGMGGVLAASIDKIYQWHPDGRTETVLGPGIQPRVIRPSRHDPARVWVGLRDGLRSLRRDGQVWRDEGFVPGLPEEVRTIVELPDGTVWIGTPTRGVFRLNFAQNPDGSRGAASIRNYLKSNGLPEKMGWTRVQPWHGGTDAIFATQAGLYRYDPAPDRFVAGDRLRATLQRRHVHDREFHRGRRRRRLDLGTCPDRGLARPGTRPCRPRWTPLGAAAQPDRRSVGRDHGGRPRGRRGPRGARSGFTARKAWCGCWPLPPNPSLITRTHRLLERISDGSSRRMARPNRSCPAAAAHPRCPPPATPCGSSLPPTRSVTGPGCVTRLGSTV